MLTVRSFFSCLLIILSSCHLEVIDPVVEIPFIPEPRLFQIAPGLIDEVSGIADSHSTDNALWVQQDSGNPAELVLISYAGDLIKRLPVLNAVNRDWEDISLVKDPVSGKHIIYIADIGDNNRVQSTYDLYRFEEPSQGDTEIKNAEKITFQYQDGSHDAEAMLVDEKTNDIYIITKRDARSGIYKIANPVSTMVIHTATLVSSFNYNGVTSAGSSIDGSEIIVKTYTHLYYYKKNGNESLTVALNRKPVSIPYIMEPQGEAFCFRKDNNGFFTLSERGLAPFVDLRYYKRK